MKLERTVQKIKISQTFPPTLNDLKRKYMANAQLPPMIKISQYSIENKY